MELDCTSGRLRSLARLSAYTLFAIFLISLLAAALPFPSGDPQRILALITEVLERSSLPLVALVFFFFGLVVDAIPALWECRLALLLRPFLWLVSLLYLLIALAIFPVAQGVETAGVRALNSGVESSVALIQDLRKGLDRASDAAGLRAVVSRQQGLVQAMREKGVAPGSDAPIEVQRRAAADLLDQAETNLRNQSLQQRSEATGRLTRQSLRLALLSVIFAIFYGFAGLIWPQSLDSTVERILEQRRGQEEAAGLDSAVRQ